MHFRLSGAPGVGKNELVYYLAREVERKPLYIMQGHEEMTPEDVACTARITPDHRVEYVGSPLLAAMLHGGICFFDEIGKVPSRSLSLLASVLDDRRTLTSVLAGFCVHAAPEFRFCAAMNDSDAAAGGLPGYIDERLRPAFRLDYPPLEEVLAIVRNGVSGASAVLLDRFRHWAANRRNVSPRSALTLIGYVVRMLGEAGAALTESAADAAIALAAEHVHA
jgi:MoxR-like ATPase